MIRLLPSRMIRLMTGFSVHRDDDVAGLGARDHDVREELGRVEFLQRGIERLGGIALAGSEVGVGADRLRLEALVAADRDASG